MRAVVDTNVLVRASIKPRGPCGPVVDAFVGARFVMVYSDPLLAEWREVLSRARLRRLYEVPPHKIEDLLALVTRTGEHVVPKASVDVCRDPDDNMILEAALAAGADAIVSADNDLLALGSFEGIPIVVPARFMEMLAEEEART